MKLNITNTRKYLKAFDFATLFREEVGWEPVHYDLNVDVNGQTYHMKTIAQKHGFHVLRFQGEIPSYQLRRKIDSQAEKSFHEHLIIYTDTNQTVQIWQWIKRAAGKPAASREHTYRPTQSGDSLIEKLEHIAVTIDDEEKLGGILGVAENVRGGFDIERVTRRFYDRFKEEHGAFTKFIKGIPDEGLQRWYVSITLNRLMFVYFIQKKGFLNGDENYLTNKLLETQKQGKDRFYTDFLCPLFFEGFAQKRRSAETKKLLGDVPYLNGGIFAKHQIEELHGEKIQIRDAAFEQLFQFFEDYQWRLDERLHKDDKEINPDVLGYIFEKYINQKQMGAYYTKEDITEYNSKNTIIPHLFDVARKECKIAFEADGALWKLLKDNPDRYIYNPVKHGLTVYARTNPPVSLDAPEPLPEHIAAGVKDVSKRGEWNKSAPEEFALPTEIWREVVARRIRYEEINRKLKNGEVTEINDLITLNLDIRQFAQDVIQNAEGVELLRAFWKAIKSVSVLDPTVGSGAFLFAALNVLESLYEACLERMEVFVNELELSGEKHSKDKYKDFKEVLDEIARHPNRRYFILKSIIINNLYGVDIMDEAVEICKLRLFLKLVAQVERAEDIEPLPDIDFNIRAGNTLVGFATYADVERSVNMGIGSIGGKEKVQSEKLFAMPEENKQLKLIEEKAEDVDRLYKRFRQQQTEYGGEVTPADKKALQDRLKKLNDELNILLARQYAIHNPKGKEYEAWLKSHTPLHWFVEFYGIMHDGGFNVIIGNPPYVEYSKVKNEYKILNYATEECGNLYAYVLERSVQLLNTKGRLGIIVPISITSSSRMSELSSLMRTKSSRIWASSFGIRPSKLFEGAEQRLSIVIACLSTTPKKADLLTTKYHRWYSEERGSLFSTFEYALLPDSTSLWGKTGSKIAKSVLSKLQSSNSNIDKVTSTRATDNFVFYNEATGYWIKSLDGLPYYNKNGKVSSPAHGRYVYFRKDSDASVVNSLLNSSMLFFYFCVFSDGYHLGDWLVKNFNIHEAMLSDNNIIDIAQKLSGDLVKNASRKSLSTKDGDKITYDELDGVSSKPIIDEIDRALARHYGLSAEELDFIINYDVKYRMGASAELEGEEE